jgi:sugar phosphate permease
MTRLARERNRSALWWSLAAIGVWIGTEIIVIFILGSSVFISWNLWGTPAHPDQVAEVMYIPGLIAALISAELMVRRLRAKPALSAEIESQP